MRHRLVSHQIKRSWRDVRLLTLCRVFTLISVQPLCCEMNRLYICIRASVSIFNSYAPPIGISISPLRWLLDIFNHLFSAFWWLCVMNNIKELSPSQLSNIRSSLFVTSRHINVKISLLIAFCASPLCTEMTLSKLLFSEESYFPPQSHFILI